MVVCSAHEEDLGASYGQMAFSETMPGEDALNSTNDLWGFLCGHMGAWLAPPPSLVKLVSATVAGSLVAIVGITYEVFRSRFRVKSASTKCSAPAKARRAPLVPSLKKTGGASDGNGETTSHEESVAPAQRQASSPTSESNWGSRGQALPRCSGGGGAPVSEASPASGTPAARRMVGPRSRATTAASTGSGRGADSADWRRRSNDSGAKGCSGESPASASTSPPRGEATPGSSAAATEDGGSASSSGSKCPGMRFGSKPGGARRGPFDGRELSEDDVAEREVKSILNKLTRDKFDKLYDQLLKCCAGLRVRTGIIAVVAREVFAKATMQHKFIEMYADLCSKLQEDLSDGADVEATFKRALLEQCQQSFNLHLEPPRIDECLDYAERYEAVVKYKTKMLGNVRLIGHLLRRRMLNPKIIFHCTDELITIGSAEALETLCAFLTTIGSTFDTPQWQGRARLDEVFVRAELFAEDDRQSHRTQCLLKDLLDQRQNDWVERAPAGGIASPNDGAAANGGGRVVSRTQSYHKAAVRHTQADDEDNLPLRQTQSCSGKDRKAPFSMRPPTPLSAASAAPERRNRT